jgi:hypothetical protein
MTADVLIALSTIPANRSVYYGTDETNEKIVFKKYFCV